jgi:hypothetical protein
VRHPRPARRRPARGPGVARGCGKISTHPPSPGHPAPHRRPTHKTRPDGQATCLNEVIAMTCVAAQRAAYGPGRTSLESISRRAGLMAGECLIVAQVRRAMFPPLQQRDALALSPLPPPLDGSFSLSPIRSTLPGRDDPVLEAASAAPPLLRHWRPVGIALPEGQGRDSRQPPSPSGKRSSVSGRESS